MTRSRRVALPLLRLRDDEFAGKAEIRQCRSVLWRRVSRLLLAVVDILDTARRGGGKAQDATRDPSTYRPP